MINTKRPSTDDYTQVGFVEAKDTQGNYQNIDRIYDNQGNIVFQQGYLNEYQGADNFGIPAIGKPLLDYTIYGNTTQSGTPSPDSPITPQGTSDLETVGVKAGQYKIPISSANTTTPVYLGEVQTTRRIKKLVFDGTENWNIYESATTRFFYTALNSKCAGTASNYFLCTHRTGLQAPSTKDSLRWYDNNTDWQDVVSFKAWLAAQYANGTPVTVWYVLANETTGIVNEPLMKIGEYADSISMEQAGVSIPTLNKPNNTVIDVLTEVEPSEIDVVYRGSTKPKYNLFLAQNGDSFEAKDGQSLYIGGGL
jgi:hypothetical protein